MTVFGKHEPPAPDPQHHGHLTALSISPQFRELGLARELMGHLEELSGPGYVVAGSDDRIDGVDAWFLDLFVRCNNKRAESMYEKLGYSIYRRVVE
jgi:N-terminal acetyltransferase B complex catalytic subunit